MDTIEQKWKILIVDDHAVIVEGFAMLLETIAQTEFVKTATNLQDAVLLLEAIQFDLIFLDIQLGRDDGRDLFKQFKPTQTQAKFIAFSSIIDGSTIKVTMHQGFDGYIVKTEGFQEIQKTIQQVRNGNPYISQKAREQIVEEHLVKPVAKISEREIEVLQLLAEGLSTKDIADQLFLSPKTIENHRMHLMEKLDVNNVAALVKKAIQQGFVKI
jgi:DNA-binding NarL/FixJ family response regulator